MCNVQQASSQIAETKKEGVENTDKEVKERNRRQKREKKRETQTQKFMRELAATNYYTYIMQNARSLLSRINLYFLRHSSSLQAITSCSSSIKSREKEKAS